MKFNKNQVIAQYLAMVKPMDQYRLEQCLECNVVEDTGEEAAMSQQQQARLKSS